MFASVRQAPTETKRKNCPGQPAENLAGQIGEMLMPKTPQQLLNEYAENIRERHSRWKTIYREGPNDPFWPDGGGLNLVRGHIIYYRYKIAELCSQYRFSKPPEYNLPIPPEMDPDYFADPTSERAKNILARLYPDITPKKPSVTHSQLLQQPSLF